MRGSRNTAELGIARSHQAAGVREIDRAAQWWSENRPATPGAIEADLKDALTLLVEHLCIGSKVDYTRDAETRRFLLGRTRYFVYYRPKAGFSRYWPSGTHRTSTSRESERATLNPLHPTCARLRLSPAGEL